MIVDVLVYAFCGLSFLALMLGHFIFIRGRDKKRNARMDIWQKTGESDNAKDTDVKWPNAQRQVEGGKGWSLKDYEKEYEEIYKLPEDDFARLDKFANLFSRALDLIVVALATQRTIPHAIFKVRDHFAREIQDNEM